MTLTTRLRDNTQDISKDIHPVAHLLVWYQSGIVFGNMPRFLTYGRINISFPPASVQYVSPHARRIGHRGRNGEPNQSLLQLQDGLSWLTLAFSYLRVHSFIVIARGKMSLWRIVAAWFKVERSVPERRNCSKNTFLPVNFEAGSLSQN